MPWLIVTLLFLSGCAASGSTAGAYGVRVDGTLRSMMHDGQWGPNVTLGEVLDDPRVYAVGALADLVGEVTVLEGQAYLAYPQGASGARTESTHDTDAGATLLVSAAVPAWRSMVTEAPIRFEELDDAIAELAAAAGVDVHQRFSFLVEGVFQQLHWHVIDGRRLPSRAATHEDHLAASIRMMRERASATLIGFYSERDQGVFTHLGSRTHIHCVVDAPLASGHVDRVVIPAGTTVKFAAPEGP